MNRAPGFSDYAFGLLLMAIGTAIGRYQMGDSLTNVASRFVGSLTIGLLLVAVVRWLAGFRIVRKERAQ